MGGTYHRIYLPRTNIQDLSSRRVTRNSDAVLTRHRTPVLVGRPPYSGRIDCIKIIIGDLNAKPEKFEDHNTKCRLQVQEHKTRINPLLNR
jgi:hypothetical protein